MSGQVVSDIGEFGVRAIRDGIANGDFTGLRHWLGENIHRHGMRYPADTLVNRVTGNPPDPSALIESLSRRYLD